LVKLSFFVFFVEIFLAEIIMKKAIPGLNEWEIFKWLSGNLFDYFEKQA